MITRMKLVRSHTYTSCLDRVSLWRCVFEMWSTILSKRQHLCTFSQFIWIEAIQILFASSIFYSARLSADLFVVVAAFVVVAHYMCIFVVVNCASNCDKWVKYLFKNRDIWRIVHSQYESCECICVSAANRISPMEICIRFRLCKWMSRFCCEPFCGVMNNKRI